MTTEQQISLIVSKFTEVRAAVGNHVLPQGAKPSISDMWAMATSLIIKDMSDERTPD